MSHKHPKQHEEDFELMAGETAEQETTESQDMVDEVIALRKENESLKTTIDNMQETVATADDKVLRAHAEMENIRRRAQKDVENAHKFALEKFANALLPVLDSMEKAAEVSAESEEAKAMSEGVILTMKMLVDTLEKFGVTQLDPQGEVFDPNKHEAMAMSPNPEMDDNMVMNVFQKGYELNNRVIRPARVLVVKN
ncbi:nucleotide exchange factor GrpE [Cysteiniphilum halobium]|uniref:nucleotide exchange factor GrpE n=1 Tax=Cysteiniphilum halobium TaxID=2219059 RepID=UPI000E64ABFF|nr:nucleotide exchange factor GrpE [Cysteiniphilum halobium]